MDSESFEVTLKTMSKRMPFQPFAVELTSGSRISIEHPEAMIIIDGTAVYMSPKKELSIFDSDGVTRIVSDLKPSSQKA